MSLPKHTLFLQYLNKSCILGFSTSTKKESIPSQKWIDVESQRQFFNELAKKLNVKTWEDWYKVKYDDIVANGGHTLLSLSYNNSHQKALISIFPEFDWKPWKFAKTQKDFWKKIENQRKFLEDLAKKLEIKDFSGWYNIERKQIVDHGGISLFSIYNGSLSKIIMSVFPEYQWKPWLFSQISKNLWDNPQVVKEYINSLAKHFNITKPEDWLSLRTQDLKDAGIKYSLLHKFGGFHNILSKAYPSYDWNSLGNQFRSKTQAHLQNLLSTLFPDAGDILNNYELPNIKFSNGGNIELDLFIPSLKLAIEYQGWQHFHQHFLYDSTEDNQRRDSEKQNICRSHGITLIEVPYWWDNNIESLKSTIYKIRPELFQVAPSSPPIPDTALIDAKESTKTPNNSIDVNPSKEILPSQIPVPYVKNWNMNDSPKDWWISEKLDGIRVYWDGKKLWFRNSGIAVKPPDSFIEDLPDVRLEGELWCGYKTFQRCSSIVRSYNSSEPDWQNSWRGMKFYVFDHPHMEWALEDRLRYLRGINLPNHVKIIDPNKCDGREHLIVYFDKIIEKGGEGVILRKPKSKYMDSGSFYKLKKYLDDEALVLESIEHGYQCKFFTGKDFVLPDTKNLPRLKPGDIITIKYVQMSENGVPISPQFHGRRIDLPWEELLARKNFEMPRYIVSKGKGRNFPVSCSGCRKIIQRDDYRITKAAVFTNPSLSLPFTVQLNMHLNIECVNNAVQRGASIESFDGKVYPSIGTTISELPNVLGITWTSANSF